MSAAPMTGTGTMATDGIEPADRGTSYDYRVRALNAAGDGGPLEHITLRVRAAALPAARLRSLGTRY